MKLLLSTISRSLVLRLIRLYQASLSLDHSPLKHLFPYGYCRFHPTCSEYSYQAVERYGVVRGTWLGFKRLLRCHPWNKGGHDPLI
jgi:putative membrane protein insertion efficiency factor